ncbi:MAG TPA: class I SAM-dependent methyltransferase [Ramlibacter sp.]|uniref:class I SAM-dependent methyltransferase n=1 Tax=Ramlibacter sp. TaxID=1917967 RepID=UPI002D800475|nr:class I SAM-dependent methyltransferase [Ramlibacter sp.]HET8746752.1 class I SAM-dependent methyltransferase [Ramlibacter sp.]
MSAKFIQTPRFPERQDRTRWVYEHFALVFREGSVLDVGCYEAPMRQFIGAERYTGVDVAGHPDVVLNLEECSRLPFEDRSYDTVMCIEVLEHLGNLHVLVEDLFRVSRKYVLISLPNAWRDARRKIERGSGKIAHYGLPTQPPADRHKWFFNVTDARQFLEGVTPPGWTCDIEVSEPRRAGVVQALRRLRHSREAYGNRYGQTVWAQYTAG